MLAEAGPWMGDLYIPSLPRDSATLKQLVPTVVCTSLTVITGLVKKIKEKKKKEKNRKPSA